VGYYEYLAGLLAPLGIYELNEGAGADELRAIGAQMDRLFAEFEEFGRELMPLTANAYGLSGFETLFPYKPAYITTEDRKRAVMALLRIRNGYFTLEAMCDTIRGCGINAIVAEGREPMTAVVTFPDNWGIPEGFERIRYRIEQILPCHLAIVYDFLYSSWSLIQEGIHTWRELEELCQCWRELEVYHGVDSGYRDSDPGGAGSGDNTPAY
jgi:hypothetical protein